jgi:HSP90 family molecular chaperone
MTKLKKQFKAESKKLLDMMINTIYTNKEIFLRELISNASDAIDKLYYRSLTDKKVSVDKDELEIRIKIDKDNRTLTISDNGIGMSEEVLNKIGENFYTTKKNGTGLGVSLSKEIVSLHGGELKYESKENHGTTALIRLPIKEEII